MMWSSVELVDLQSVEKRTRELGAVLDIAFVGSNPTDHTKFYYK